ncbi:uncharacterized protein LOC141913837 [Tubulanus polymorphus]|uniref:uncharacterized protein LOC141913837 n=1 Tax=Tubulanus polymorphus TaxID=672921 RepID=UPI003DA667C7
MFSASTPKKSRLSVSDHTPGLTAILSNETNSAVEESVFEESVFSSALPGNPCESKDILNESVFEESVISAVLPGNLSEGKNVLDESVFEESIISTVLPSNLSGGNEDNSVFEESVLNLVLPSHPIEANDILDESVFEESAGAESPSNASCEMDSSEDIEFEEHATSSDSQQQPLESSLILPHSKSRIAESSRYPKDSLFNKKTSSTTLLKSLHVICKKRCTDFLHMTDIKNLRESYWCRNISDRHQFIVDTLQTCTQNTSRINLTVMGRSVCQGCWLNVYGISKSTLYKIKSKQDKSECPENISIRKSSPEFVEATSWLSNYLENTVQSAPDKTEKWLPQIFRKIYLYREYKTEKSDNNDRYVSQSTFYRIWSELFSFVKIKKGSTFSKCDDCVRIQRLLQSTQNPISRKEIMAEKQRHISTVMTERLAYYARVSRAQTNPNRYVSLIVDGMDQTKSFLPHFAGEKGKSYVDYHLYPHNSNMTMNVILKTLWCISKNGQLPPHLYLQADNCGRENKNKYVLALLQILVEKKIFNEIQLSFLFVGHTHEDIDQLISVYAGRLRREDAFDMAGLLKLCDGIELGGLLDIRSWLAPHIVNMKNHSKPRIFRRDSQDQSQINMYYRCSSTQEWHCMEGGVLTSIPTGTPSVLDLNYSIIEIKDMKKNMEKWKSFLPQEKQGWWNDFLDTIETKTVKLADSAVWYLPFLKAQEGIEQDINEKHELPNPSVNRRFVILNLNSGHLISMQQNIFLTGTLSSALEKINY